MTAATAKKPGFSDYIVADIGLADFGRKEISLAETEMPGLMATRDHAAAAVAAAGIPVFAIKGESLKDYWDYTARMFDWHGGGYPNMILDDGGDATMYVHLGLRAEKGDTAFLDKPGSEEEEVFFALLKKQLKEKPKGYFQAIADSIKGVS